MNKQELVEKLNITGQELDCVILDNERYKLALKLACKEIAADRYLLHGDDLDEKKIKGLVHKFLLKAKEQDWKEFLLKVKEVLK